MRLPPEVNRILFVRNLPFKITPEEMYDIFGKYGTIFQIRLGDKPDTRGTAFVVYDDIYDAKNAVDHLNGFNVCGRYLVVLYYQVRCLPLCLPTVVLPTCLFICLHERFDDFSKIQCWCPFFSPFQMRRLQECRLVLTHKRRGKN